MTITLEEAYHGATKRVTLQDPASGRSRTLDVKIPPGTTQQSKIRLGGQGFVAGGHGPASDVLLNVTIARHPRFELQGHDVTTSVCISPWEAALGAKVPVQTLDGQVMLTIPAGAQTGQKLRLRQKGLPHRGSGSVRGDLLVQLKTVVPKSLSDREKQLFESLAKESAFDPRSDGTQDSR